MVSTTCPSDMSSMHMSIKYRSCVVVDLPDINPNYLGDSNLFSMRCFMICESTCFSKILHNTDVRLIGIILCNLLRAFFVDRNNAS